MIYDVTVLENWEDTTELGLQEAPADLSDLPASFGATHLFIDDCANDSIECWDGGNLVSKFTAQTFCYNYLICMPCEPYGHTQPDRCSTRDYWTNKCNSGIVAGCSGQCHADYYGRGLICNP